MECEHKEVEPTIDTSRRKFLTSVTILLGGMITSVLGWNVGRYFISPIWEQRKDDFIPMCSFESLTKGKPLSIEYIHRERDGWEIHEGRNSLWLIREENNKVTAFNKSCTHLGCPYSWDENENIFKCPCHTATFAKDGKVLSGPPERPLDRFPVKIENGMVMVKPETVTKEEVERS